MRHRSARVRASARLTCDNAPSPDLTLQSVSHPLKYPALVSVGPCEEVKTAAVGDPSGLFMRRDFAGCELVQTCHILCPINNVTSSVWCCPLLSCFMGRNSGFTVLKIADRSGPVQTCLWFLVRPRRLELPRVLPHSDLNAARLPIPPRPHIEERGL